MSPKIRSAAAAVTLASVVSLLGPRAWAEEGSASDLQEAFQVISATSFGGKAFAWRSRSAAVDRIVIHSIADLNAEEADWFAPEAIFALLQRTGLSAHYFIARDGRTYELVPSGRQAFHAGRMNERSIGIELAGLADDGWIQEKVPAGDAAWMFTDAQYEALNKLLRVLSERHPSLDEVLLHRDVYERQMEVTASSGVNVRSEAGTSSKILETLPQGRKVFLSGREAAVKDDEGRSSESLEKKWLQVEYAWGALGWVRADLLEDAGWGERKKDPGRRFEKTKVDAKSAGLAWVTSHGGD